MEGNKRNIKIKKVIKRAKGVTMLALVVTIIVLLILAAITLNLAIGENGIIARAKLARDKAKNASIEEEELMNVAVDEIDNAGLDGSDGSGEGGACPDTKPLEDRIKELESQLEVLQQQLENERADKVKLESQITELNNQIEELKRQIEGLKNQIAELEKQIADLQKVNNLENEALKAEIEELKRQIVELNKQIVEKNKIIEEQRQTIANLEGQIREKDKLIAQKDETIKNMQSTIDELNEQIANLNRQIEELRAKQATGNAIPSDVLTGKTFSNSSGVGLVGTMANRAGQIVSWSGYETIALKPHPDDNSQGLVTISNQYGADGYYNGDSKITGNIANLNANNIKAGVNVGRFDGTAGITGTFTSDGTATANNLSNGATAYVNGQKITGNGTDVNNAWSNGHTAGWNEGYSAGNNAVKGQVKTRTHTSSSGLGDNPTINFDVEGEVLFAGISNISCTVYSWDQNYNHHAGINFECSWSGSRITVKLTGGNCIEGGKNINLTVYYILK